MPDQHGGLAEVAIDQLHDVVGAVREAVSRSSFGRTMPA
jgi:hypothetical protein